MNMQQIADSINAARAHIGKCVESGIDAEILIDYVFRDSAVTYTECANLVPHKKEKDKKKGKGKKKDE